MIREIQLKDKDQWEKLYKGYADFYKAEMRIEIFFSLIHLGFLVNIQTTISISVYSLQI